MARDALTGVPRTQSSTTAISNRAAVPTLNPSRFRTSFFTGRINAPRFVSGKTEVRHVVAPTVTSTLIEPKPAAR